MVPEAVATIKRGARWERNAEIRHMMLEMMSTCCRQKPTRVYLKATQYYIIIRELHKWEKEQVVEKEILHAFFFPYHFGICGDGQGLALEGH